MLGKLKRQWRDLKQAAPGTRFKRRYENRRKTRRSAIAKPFYLGAGVLVFLFGIVLLPAPGPGFIFVAIGAALMAEESYFAASVLDWLEVRARVLLKWTRRMWENLPLALKSLAVGAAAITVGAAGWGAYVLVFD